jgi:rhodanese-related sulfurtransferase
MPDNQGSATLGSSENQSAHRTASAAEVRAALLARREIALLDVREEAIHATGHPLFAANLPLSLIELEAYARLPRRAAQIVLFDDGEGLAAKAARRLADLGYEDVRQLKGGLQAWRDAGYEIFQDVNAPSKAFGELVEAIRHTPSLSAQEVQALIDAKADVAIVDVRRFDEYQTMNIPTAISVPGVELLLRIRELAPSPATQVIVNCAGRTRSIIGTQSLINAGVPNPVFALRNGTIGWTLAGQRLHHDGCRSFGPVSDATRSLAAESALRVAGAAGVERTNLRTVGRWADSGDATIYRFDVRTPREYEAGHLPGFRNAPGGQLVQETEMFAPVRGSIIVLADDDGTRANITASWLAQMGWRVFVVDELDRTDFAERGPWKHPMPTAPVIPDGAMLTAATLHHWLSRVRLGGLAVLDLAPSAKYRKEHIPGAWFASRSQLEDAFHAHPEGRSFVLTSPDGVLARFAWSEAASLTEQKVFVLEGGSDAWTCAGLPTESAQFRYAAPPIDRYRRPYEGTDIPQEAVQAYLDWEYGLVAQLDRDGTHGFRVI